MRSAQRDGRGQPLFSISLPQDDVGFGFEAQALDW